MRKTILPLSGLCLLVVLLTVSCKKAADPWAEFKACAANTCVPEALAVKDAFLADPKAMLAQFQETYAKGEDHVIGWLNILRDSVLFSSRAGATEERFALQQAIVEAARPFANDPVLGEMANSILDEIETLAIISEQEDTPPSLTGTFSYELPNNAGSGELKVNQLDDASLRFSLSVTGGPPAHNMGMMEGKATIRDGNVADIITNEYGGTCHLQLAFSGNQVVIKTLEGNPPVCGFGNNVIADGTYKLVDELDPFRGEGGDPSPANIQGRWQSASDPLSELMITGGDYIEIYNGKEISKLVYAFHNKCPEDCNPGAEISCLKVIGQDWICYALVKADGKTLELSMIGGTGNTLTYRKKK